MTLFAKELITVVFAQYVTMLVPSDSRLCSQRRNLSSPLCPLRTRLRNALRLLPLARGSVASTYAPTPRAAAFAAARLALTA